MKFILQSFLLFLAPFAAFSQITIVQSDIPMVAGTFIWGRDTSSVITPGSQGANVTWDFSAFVPANTDTITDGDPFIFTPDPLFSAANFVRTANTTNLTTESFGFIDSTGMYAVGHEATMNTQNYTAHGLTFMNPMVVFYPFPFTYNDTRTMDYIQDQITTYVPASPYDSIKSIYHRTRTINCDGWGTLITPYGTHNTIRLQRIEISVDTTFNHTTSGWVLGSANSEVDTTYEWVAKNIGSVATMRRSSPGYHYRFYKSGTTGIAAVHPASVKIYPNPVTGLLRVDAELAVSRLSITTLTGQEVFRCEEVRNSMDIDLGNFAPGIYLLHAATADGKSIIQKIVKQ